VANPSDDYRSNIYKKQSPINLSTLIIHKENVRWEEQVSILDEAHERGRLIRRYVGASGEIVGIADRDMRASVDPVVTAVSDVVASKIVAAEAKVVSGKRAVRVVEVSVVAGNVGVVADLVTRVASQVTTETAQAGVELLEDNSLSLNLADLFSDNLLCHFLENEKALLDDSDLLSVADQLAVLFHDNAVLRAREVVTAVEVIKVGEGRYSVPIVERRPFVPFRETGLGNGSSNDAGNQKRNGDKRCGNLGEHGG